ncbi:MAG: YdeI/OmpD-associated family protein [Chitinophagaceae bacterium]
MLRNILEKLELSSQDNILIQGCPSSLDRIFSKLSYVKNLTILLKQRKIDFALIFSIQEKQFNLIMEEIFPSLKKSSIFWVAFPKITSKIYTDLYKPESFAFLQERSYISVAQISLDVVWQAIRFVDKTTIHNIELFESPPKKLLSGINMGDYTIDLPEDLDECFANYQEEYTFFKGMKFEYKVFYLLWLNASSKLDIREKRLELIVDKLSRGILNPLVD